MLALVVGGAASVEPVALHRRHPWLAVIVPAVVLALHRIAVTVEQNGLQVGALMSLGNQEGAADWIAVLMHLPMAPQRLNGRHDGLAAVLI